MRDEEREGAFLGVGNCKLGLGGGWIRLCCRGQAYQGAQILTHKTLNRSPILQAPPHLLTSPFELQKMFLKELNFVTFLGGVVKCEVKDLEFYCTGILWVL